MKFFSTLSETNLSQQCFDKSKPTWSMAKLLVSSAFTFSLASPAFSQDVVQSFEFPSSMISANTSYTGSGDGYRVLPYQERFYYINHHKAASATSFGCIDRNTSSNCTGGGGWPKRLPDGDTSSSQTSSTSLISEDFVLVGNEFFYPVTRYPATTTTNPSDWGIGCYDLDTHQECGYIALGGTSSTNTTYGIGGLVRVGNNGYVLDTDMKVHCVDFTSKFSCGSFDLSLPANGNLSKITTIPSYHGNFAGEPIPNSDNVFFSFIYDNSFTETPPTTTRKVGICIDTTTMQHCSGWGGPKTFSHLPSQHNFSNFISYDSSGTADSICSYGNVVPRMSCLNLLTGGDSSGNPTNSAFSSAMSAHTGLFSVGYHGLGGEQVIGDQTFFPTYFQGKVFCYDWSIQDFCSTTSPFTAFPLVSPSNPQDYSVTKDDANCLWAFGNLNQLWSVDPVTRLSPCHRGSLTRIVRKDCESSWHDIYVENIASEDYDSLTLRVKNNQGVWIEFDLLTDSSPSLSHPQFQYLSELEYEIVAVYAQGFDGYSDGAPVVEVRTIDGNECICCPPWNQAQMESIFGFKDLTQTQYNFTYTSSSLLDTQMEGWLAYAQSLMPNVESVAIGFWVGRCDQNIPIGNWSSCPSSLIDSPHDLELSLPIDIDYNIIEWDGVSTNYYTFGDPYTYPTGWDQLSGASPVITRPFDINRLYKVWAIPILRMSDGSIETFWGLGQDCPITSMEMNFQIGPNLLMKKANEREMMKLREKLKIKSSTVSRQKFVKSKEGKKLISQLEHLVKKSKMSEGPGKIGATKWTNWLNTDRPSGNGDYQTIKGLSEQGLVCSEPLKIECRTANLKTEWWQTGEELTCNTSTGHVCNNRNQKDGRCEDYEVRYLCPSD